jgi:O-antigen/teichoic acid export membrane protein
MDTSCRSAGSDHVAKYFNRLEPSSELKSMAVRGGAATVLSQGLSFGINVVGTIVLARLLTPRDFGLVTIVTTFSLLLQNFGSYGFTEAVIQRETVSHDQLSTLFWISVVASSLLTLTFIAVSVPVAWFYKEPELKAICVAVSFSIVFDSLGAQHIALLKRNMQFGTVYLNLVGARTIGLLGAITAAKIGWGYWALVANVLLCPLLTSVGVWACCTWRPGLPKMGTGVRSIVKFVLNTYGYFCTNYVARNIDNVLVGWCYGSVSLGIYKKAYDLFALPVNQLSAPLTSVALASLGRLRADPVRFQRYYLKTISVLAFVGMGLGATLTLTGKDVLRILLGPQWDEAGRIFTYFGPGIGIMLVYNTIGWLHLSLGRANRWFRWGIVEMVVTCLMFVIALPFGPRGLAVAWVCSFCLLIGPGLSYAGRPIRISFLSVLSATWRYTLSAIVPGLVCWSLLSWIDPFVSIFATMSSVTRIGVLLCVFGGMYYCMLRVFSFSSTLGPVFDILKILKPK